MRPDSSTSAKRFKPLRITEPNLSLQMGEFEIELTAGDLNVGSLSCADDLQTVERISTPFRFFVDCLEVSGDSCLRVLASSESRQLRMAPVSLCFASDDLLSE